MAEKTTVEIVAEAAEDFFDADQAAELGRKVEGLEWEKLELQRENKETKEKIQELMAEIEKLKSSEKETKERLREMELVIERTEEGKDVLESVANRAMELETEIIEEKYLRKKLRRTEGNENHRSIGSGDVFITSVTVNNLRVGTASPSTPPKPSNLDHLFTAIKIIEHHHRLWRPGPSSVQVGIGDGCCRVTRVMSEWDRSV
ncbi:hypothetical protein ACFX2I_031001 [Malus domestica]